MSVCALHIQAHVCLLLQICIGKTYLRVSARVCSFGRLSRFCVSLPGSSVLTHFTVISEGIITDGG